MRRHAGLSGLAALATALTLTVFVAPASATHGGDVLVSNGSPATTFSQNKQNEPALAVDASHPTLLAAGANDNIDLEACNAGDPTTCPFTPGIGVSGVYFSFDSGDSWLQPTYTGLTARGCLGPAACTPTTGSIGTLPWYSENGLSSDGDPALAFGPTPDSGGNFSWSNGSRLYYANLTANLPDETTFRGAEAIAVSRMDIPASGLDDTTGPAFVGTKGNWMPPVIASRQSSTTFSDKEQIWADNASSSPFFGYTYVCISSFRSLSHGLASPNPMIVGTSRDGGTTWSLKQVTPATNNPFNPVNGFGRSGCSIRTDSNGVAYVVANQFAVGLPGTGSHILVKSFNGGQTWTRPQTITSAIDGCSHFDPVIGRCVMDGVAGARDDLSSAPSIDIANGAPTGADATNQIVDTWVDEAGGPDQHVKVITSTDGGNTWSSPVDVEQAGDFGYYSAAALSWNGTDVWIVYNAFTTPFRTSAVGPTNDRELVGVVLHADISGGTIGAFSEIHRGASGDARGSSQNNLQAEFLGDYVYAVATRTYGAGVWNDVRNAADCGPPPPDIDNWRQSLRDGTTATKPAPNSDCPSTFGNSDIYGGSFADPTP
jgi:hypothetical protein